MEEKNVSSIDFEELRKAREELNRELGLSSPATENTNTQITQTNNDSVEEPQAVSQNEDSSSSDANVSADLTLEELIENLFGDESYNTLFDENNNNQQVKPETSLDVSSSIEQSENGIISEANDAQIEENQGLNSNEQSIQAEPIPESAMSANITQSKGGLNAQDESVYMNFAQFEVAENANRFKTQAPQNEEKDAVEEIPENEENLNILNNDLINENQNAQEDDISDENFEEALKWLESEIGLNNDNDVPVQENISENAHTEEVKIEQVEDNEMPEITQEISAVEDNEMPEITQEIPAVEDNEIPEIIQEVPTVEEEKVQQPEEPNYIQTTQNVDANLLKAIDDFKEQEAKEPNQQSQVEIDFPQEYLNENVVEPQETAETSQEQEEQTETNSTESNYHDEIVKAPNEVQVTETQVTETPVDQASVTEQTIVEAPKLNIDKKLFDTIKSQVRPVEIPKKQNLETNVQNNSEEKPDEDGLLTNFEDYNRLEKLLGGAKEVRDIFIDISKEVEEEINKKQKEEKDTIEVPEETHKDIESYKFVDIISTEDFKNSNKYSYILGKNEDGEIIYGNLIDSYNVAIFGDESEHLTNLIHSILLSLMLKNEATDINVVVCDAKSDSKLSIYDKSSYMYFNRVAKTNKEIIDVLIELSKELEERYKLFAELGVKSIEQYNIVAKNDNLKKLPYIFTMFNNYSLSMQQTGSDKVNTCLYQILKYGRIVGMYASIIGNTAISYEEINYNLPTRISFKMQDSSKSLETLGFVGAENLQTESDALYSSLITENLTHLKVPQLTDAEIKLLIENIEE